MDTGSWWPTLAVAAMVRVEELWTQRPLPHAPPEARRCDASEVAAELGVDVTTGLSSIEAAARLERDGPNLLDAAEQVTAWRKLLRQFDDPLIHLLLVAVVVSFIAWLLEGHEGVPFEVIVILVIVLLNRHSGVSGSMSPLTRMCVQAANRRGVAGRRQHRCDDR